MKKSDISEAFLKTSPVPAELFLAIETGIHTHARRMLLLRTFSIVVILCLSSTGFLLSTHARASSAASLEVINDMHSFFASDSLLDESKYYALVDETTF